MERGDSQRKSTRRAGKRRPASSRHVRGRACIPRASRPAPFSVTYFVAPINLLDGEIEHVVNVGVVVIEERKNYYHAHQVLLPDGSVLKVGDKNKTATGLAVASSKDAVVAPTVTASVNIIRNPQEENNPSGENSEETFYNDLSCPAALLCNLLVSCSPSCPAPCRAARASKAPKTTGVRARKSG